MGVFVSIFDEIINRLNSENIPSGLLEDIKEIQIGPKKDNQGVNKYPSLVISTQPSFITESFEGARRDRKIADLSINIRILDKVTASRAINLYFDTSTQKGILYLIEKILDVIHTDSSGNLDPRFASLGKRSAIVEVGELQLLQDEVLMCDISITAQLKDFEINKRRT